MNAETPKTVSVSPHPNVNVLLSIYADLTRIGEYACDDIVLHAAERGSGNGRHTGKRAVVAKEQALIRLTGNTLVMDVEQITANDHFGAVLGVLRAHRGDENLAVPFCGLWRFRDGKVVEHWENAYDQSALTRFVTHAHQSKAD
ncbi:nuclear transport factor 2 family protein [Amycolatopsis sp. EV170708-02-1]|uniref:nuclear transport factor 2 family protein n=1 Tax=Amycolatopsis sp. EV170708-02-1 TaxID=2919322 RepID=UPI001F0C0741|nr:nuclear transport factor 2 family protein [Amycolatopsis sp. EV170708-02-1]UMP06792.1 nuclear transport factor 2 family protein [Amycolatopsis sp. EV170708-02-1]